MKKILIFIILGSIYLPVLAQNFVYNSNISKDSLQCLQNISVYREFKKMKLRENAIDAWKKVYNNCPGYKKIIYQDGAKFLIQSIKNEQNNKTKEQLIDSLMHLYRKRIKYFGEEDYIKGKMGLDLYLYDKEKTNEAYKLLLFSIEKLQEKSPLNIIYTFIAASGDLYKQSNLKTREFIDNYLICYHLLNNKLQKQTEPKKRKQVLYSLKSIKKIFAKNTINRCKELIQVLNERISAKPDNFQEIKNVNVVLQAANCIHSDLFYQTALKIDKIKPDAENAYLLAGIELQKNNYHKAEIYFQKAIDLTKSSSLKSKYYTDLAIMQYSKLNDFEKAQKSFDSSLKYSTHNAKIYYLMADMYAAYQKNFNKKDLDYYSLLWLSIDYYLKAQKENPKIRKKAEEKIAYYRNFLPRKEDIFFYGLKAGQEYKINGWINKITTVRVR